MNYEMSEGQRFFNEVLHELKELQKLGIGSGALVNQAIRDMIFESTSMKVSDCADLVINLQPTE